MTKKVTIILHLCLLALLSRAQNTQDSLQNMSYKEIVELSNTYPEKYSHEYSEDEINVITLLLKKAKKHKDTLQIANAYRYHYLIYKKHQQTYLDSIISLTKFNSTREYPAYAYLKKAKFFFVEKRNVKKTLHNLDLARKYAKSKDNEILLYRIDYFIAVVRSEHLGEKERALKIYKKCANFFSKCIEEDHEFRYLHTLHAISEIYIYLKKYDSATYYNRLGYTKALKSSDPKIIGTLAYFTISEGINAHERKKYSVAIDSIHKALPKILSINDKLNIVEGYFYLGKSYYALRDTEKSIYYFKKTDSILETLNAPPRYEHLKTYEVLKVYYKEKGDLQNQIKYLDKLNSFLDHYANDKIFIGKKIRENYDVPVLLEEQEELIKKLNKSSDTYIYSILLLTLFLLILGSLFVYQYIKRRVYRSRFEKLMEAQVLEKDIGVKTQQVDIDVIIDVKEQPEKVLKVPEKHVIYILEKLEVFEKNKEFLTSGISAQSLADDMETNVKYLSRVINYHKNKTFNHYLNELRVQYAVEELKSNTILRKYTIKAIALEMGYKSSETFSNAFYKQLGIKPSYFIKNLNKLESTYSL